MQKPVDQQAHVLEKTFYFWVAKPPRIGASTPASMKQFVTQRGSLQCRGSSLIKAHARTQRQLANLAALTRHECAALHSEQQAPRMARVVGQATLGHC